MGRSAYLQVIQPIVVARISPLLISAANSARNYLSDVQLSKGVITCVNSFDPLAAGARFSLLKPSLKFQVMRHVKEHVSAKECGGLGNQSQSPID
jgi:hypothetical protein